MSNLVQVPWQPECWLTPDTLALLVAASDKLGAQLQINGSDGAWRSYATQSALYQLSLRGGNTASNPDTGQRNHMRGAAFDLVRTDASAQAACRAVGLIRDAAETWHWNNPGWASMPIIPTNTNVADSGSTTSGEEDMVTQADIDAIADATSKKVWWFQLAEPPGGVTPGRAVPAGDWLRYSDVREMQSRAQIAALSATITTLATAKGLDPAAIVQAAHDGAAQALANLTLKAAQ